MARFKLCMAMIFLLLLGACKSQPAHVYSGVDPTVKMPSKTEAIFLALPDGATIREKKVAILLKDELLKNGFNIVPDVSQSKWIFSFAVDRKTYTVGTSTSGSAVGAKLYGVPLAFGNSTTTNINQTDVSIYTQLYSVSDLEKTKPAALWEGSVSVEDRFFTASPNATIKSLIDKFGLNYDRRIKLDRRYQKAANLQAKSQ